MTASSLTTPISQAVGKGVSVVAYDSPLPGTWRDVLRGSRHTLDPGVPLARVVDAYGLVVLERI